MLIMRFVKLTCPVGVMILSAVTVCGQDYPNKPVRIVTNAVGGGSDFVARIVAQGIAGPMGQPVIVENRGGGFAAGETVSKAPPDGYTLLLSGGSFTISPLLQDSPFDPVRDFAPITLAVRAPTVLVVHPSLPVRSVKELIALAKARPGELNYGTAGTGGTSHLAGELLKSMAKVNIVRINYKSSGPALNAILGGELQLTFGDFSPVVPHVKSGKLTAIAVTSAVPSALTPGVPTVAATLPGFEAVSMTSIVAPAKTPAPIINRLYQEIVRFLKTAEAKEKFLNNGSEVVGGSPEELAAAMKSEIARMGKVIKEAGIKAE